MPNTTTRARTAAAQDVPSPAGSVDQARAAWATAGRDDELARWAELYELAVTRPEIDPPEAGFGPGDATGRAAGAR
jgi:hypothetical protein